MIIKSDSASNADCESNQDGDSHYLLSHNISLNFQDWGKERNNWDIKRKNQFLLWLISWLSG